MSKDNNNQDPIVALATEHRKDYTVWNAVNNAYEILDGADAVTVEAFRDATFYLRKAIEALKKKGKQV